MTLACCKDPCILVWMRLTSEAHISEENASKSRSFVNVTQELFGVFLEKNGSCLDASVVSTCNGAKAIPCESTPTLVPHHRGTCG